MPGTIVKDSQKVEGYGSTTFWTLEGGGYLYHEEVRWLYRDGVYQLYNEGMRLPQGQNRVQKINQPVSSRQTEPGFILFYLFFLYPQPR